MSGILKSPVKLVPLLNVFNMCDWLARQQFFSVVLDELVDVEVEPGWFIQRIQRKKITVERPFRLWVADSGRMDRPLMDFDQGRMRLYDFHRGFLTHFALPERIDDMIDYLTGELPVLSIPLADLIHGKLRDVFETKSRNMRYAGIEYLRGHPCHHFAYHLDDLNWQLWMRMVGQPSPLRFSVHHVNRPGNPSYQVEIRSWRVLKQGDLSNSPSPVPSGLHSVEPGQFFGANCK